MKRTIMTLAAAAAIGTAGLAATPHPAHAIAWWVAPAIVGGVVVGGVVGAAAANNNYAYAPQPGGQIYVAPAAASRDCRVIRERVRGGWRRVEICQ